MLAALGLAISDDRLRALAEAAVLALENDAVGIESGYLPGLGERDARVAALAAPVSVPHIVTGRPDSTDGEVDRGGRAGASALIIPAISIGRRVRRCYLFLVGAPARFAEPPSVAALRRLSLLSREQEHAHDRAGRRARLLTPGFSLVRHLVAFGALSSAALVFAVWLARSARLAGSLDRPRLPAGGERGRIPRSPPADASAALAADAVPQSHARTPPRLSPRLDGDRILARAGPGDDAVVQPCCCSSPAWRRLPCSSRGGSVAAPPACSC